MAFRVCGGRLSHHLASANLKDESFHSFLLLFFIFVLLLIYNIISELGAADVGLSSALVQTEVSQQLSDEFCPDIYVPLRMNCNNFGDALTLCLAPPSGQNFLQFVTKCPPQLFFVFGANDQTLLTS